MARRTRLLAHLQLLDDGTLGSVPGLSDLLDLASVVDLVEEWHDDEPLVTLAGSARIAADAEVALGGFTVGLGPPGGRGLVVPFGVTLPAGPVRMLLAGMSVSVGLVELGEVVDDLEGVDLEDAVSEAVSALGDVALRVGPVIARLDFPEQWLQRGRLVTDGGQVVDIEPIDGAPPVSVPLGQVELEVSPSGVELVVDGPASGEVPVSLPPVIVAETGVALSLEDVVWHRGGQLPQQAVDLGLPSDWRGLLVGQARVWGLERLLPFLPEGDAAQDPGTELTLTDWVIDDEGLRGRVELALPDEQDAFATNRSFALEFDRSWWPVACRAEADLDVGGLVGDEERRVGLTADLRIDPHAEAAEDRWELELALRGADGDALVEFEGAALTGLGAACASLEALTGDGQASDAGLLLGALAALDALGLASWDALAVTGASGSVRARQLPRSGGGERSARVLELRADLRLAVSIEPAGQDPIPLELGASAVTAELVLGDASDLDVPQLSVQWSVADGVRVTLPATVDIGGALTITDATLAKTDDGLALELGIDASGSDDVAVGGLPDVLTVTYRPDADPPDRIEIDLGRRGQAITLLVPGALYAEGSLRREGSGTTPIGSGGGWGETLRGELRAFMVVRDEVSSPDDLLKKETYAFDLEVGLLSATRDDGLQAFVLTLDAGFRPGLPIGTSGAALYGLGLTFAQNGAPAADDGDYAGWFLDTPPLYSTVASKWEPRAGNWGFGASATIGSQPDNGTSWNVTAGLFLLLPGPVILITGEGDLFAELPKLPAEGGDPDELSAAFAAILALDFHRNRFSADLRGELEKTAGDRTLVSATIPASVRVDLENPADFLVALGMPEPESDRVQANVLDLYQPSSYLLVTGQEFTLPDVRPEVRLPGVAVAFGGAGGLDWSLKAGPAAIELWARAGFDVGLSLSLPLIAGQIWVDGGIEVSAFGFGASLTAKLTLLAMAPDPFFLAGSVRVTLELPWFLPDVDFDADLVIGAEGGWLDDAPEPASPVEALSLWDRGTGAPQVIDPGDEAAGVPLDAIPELTFNAPVGNHDVDLGSLRANGDDRDFPVWTVATTANDDDGAEERLGYRYRITDCSLEKVSGPSTTLSDVPAWWPQGTETGDDKPGDANVPRTSGGQPARDRLRLFELSDPVHARVGVGAELAVEWMQGWDPCTIPPDDSKGRVRTYTARSLAHLLERGGFKPPILEVDLEPIDPALLDVAGAEEESDDDGGSRPTLRPGTQIPRIDVGRPPVIDRDPPPEAGDPPPDKPGPLGKLGRASLRQRLRGVKGVEGVKRAAERIAGRGEGQGADQDEDEGAATPSLAALEPLLARKLRVAETRVHRRLDVSTTEMTQVMELSGSLPLMWASRSGVVELETEVPYVLPNDTPPDELTARLIVEPTPASAGLWHRAFGLTAEPARLGTNPADVEHPPMIAGPDDPVFALPRLIVPSAASGEETMDDESLARMATAALGRVRVDLPYSDRAEAVLLLAPGVQPLVWAVLPDGEEELLGTGSGQEMSLGVDAAEGKWRLLRVPVNKPVVALRLAAAHGLLAPEPPPSRLPLVASLLAVRSYPPLRDRGAAARRSRDATAEIISDLLDQRDAWGDGEAEGVLEPSSTYKLVVKGVANPVRERGGQLEVGSQDWDWDAEFEFETADSPPASLRALPGDADPEGTDDADQDAPPLAAEGSIDDLWQVATSPGHGAPAHYLDDPLLVRLRDARTLAVFTAFGRELRVRLRDEHGNDIDEAAEAALRAASDLPAHERPIRDHLGTLGCLIPDGVNPDLLWQEAVISLPSLLAPRRRYVAELHAVESGETSGDAVHRWRFRTSRWPGLREHLAAHAPLDEVVPDGAEVQQALSDLLADTAGDSVTIDDEALDEWLVDTLRLPPRRAPDSPELVRVWAWDHEAGTAAPVALLLDNDEPLLRDSAEAMSVSAPLTVHDAKAGTDVPVRVVTGRSRARVLLVPEAGQLPSTPSLVIEVTSRSATADKELAVPDKPSVLDGAA